MKTKILHIAGAIACATLTAMALAGCANDKFEPNPAENGKLTTVSLTTGIERAPLTRTDITDPANPIWTAGDAIGVHFVSGAEMKATNKKLAGTFTPDFDKATFAGQIAGLTAGEYTIYGYYPHGTLGDLTYNPAEGRILVPAVQQPTATSFDPAADVMIMRPIEITHNGGAITRNDLQFKRALATLRISLDAPGLDGEAIDKLTVSTDDPALSLTGRGMFDLTTGEFTGFYYDATGTVTAKPQGDIFADGNDMLHLCVAPGTIAAGTEITFTGETAHYEFSKTVIVPAEGIELAPGTYFDMNVDGTDMEILESTAFDPTIVNGWVYDNRGAGELESGVGKINNTFFKSTVGQNEARMRVTLNAFFEMSPDAPQPLGETRAANQRQGIYITMSDAPAVLGFYDNFLVTYVPMSKLGQEISLTPNDDPDTWELEFELYYDDIALSGSGSDPNDIAEGRLFVDREGNNIVYKLAVKFTDGTILKANYDGAAVDQNPPTPDVTPGANQLAYNGELFDMKTLIYLDDREDEGLGGLALVDGDDRGYGTEKQLEVYLPLEAFDGGTTNLMTTDTSMWSVKYYTSNANYFIKSPERSDPEGSMTSGEISIEFDMESYATIVQAHFVYGGAVHLRVNYRGALQGL